MTTTEILLDLYLDVNILLIVAAAGWVTLLAVLGRTRLRHCHEALLRGSYALCLAVIVLPVLLFVIGRTGQAAPILSKVSLSDFAVAQFLDGRIEMSPIAFENALNLRAGIVRDAAAFQGFIGQGIALLLLLGLIVGGFGLLRDLTHVWRLRRDSFTLHRKGRVAVLLSDTATVPFSTRGLRTFYAVVPTDFLIRPGDLRIAVSHELQHIRQGDVTWEVLLELLRPVFFWNPAFHFIKREIENRRELACDRQVLARRRVALADYADCLLRTCERLLQSRRDLARLPTPSVPFAACNGSGARNVLVARFETLCQPVQSRGIALPAVFLGTLMAVVIVAGAAMHAQSEWSHDRIMLSTIVNLERLDSRTISHANW